MARPAAAILARCAAIAGEAANGGGERGRVAGRDEESVEAVGQKLARRRRVRGDQRRGARERLKRLVRDHASGLVARAEDAERAPGGLEFGGQVLVFDPRRPLDVCRPVGEKVVQLAAADDAKRDLGCEPGSSEDRLEAVQRDQLADEKCVERRLRLPAGSEETILRSHEAHGDAVVVEVERPAEELRMSLRVGDDDVGAPERPPIDESHHLGGGRAAAEAPAIDDDCVVQRDERVEDDGSPARDALRGGKVEVARIADDQRLGVPVGVTRLSEAVLGAGDAHHLAQARPSSCAAAPRPAGAARPPRRRPLGARR